MRNSIISIAILAGAFTFTAGAWAHDNMTDANRQSSQAARGTAAVSGGDARQSLGYGNQEHSGGFAGAQHGPSGLSARDALLFELGDRGLGQN